MHREQSVCDREQSYTRKFVRSLKYLSGMRVEGKNKCLITKKMEKKKEEEKNEVEDKKKEEEGVIERKKKKVH